MNMSLLFVYHQLLQNYHHHHHLPAIKAVTKFKKVAQCTFVSECAGAVLQFEHFA